MCERDGYRRLKNHETLSSLDPRGDLKPQYLHFLDNVNSLDPASFHDTRGLTCRKQLAQGAQRSKVAAFAAKKDRLPVLQASREMDRYLEDHDPSLPGSWNPLKQQGARTKRNPHSLAVEGTLKAGLSDPQRGIGMSRYKVLVDTAAMVTPAHWSLMYRRSATPEASQINLVGINGNSFPVGAPGYIQIWGGGRNGRSPSWVEIRCNVASEANLASHQGRYTVVLSCGDVRRIGWSLDAFPNAMDKEGDYVVEQCVLHAPNPRIGGNWP